MDTGKYAEEYRRVHHLKSLPELIKGSTSNSQSTPPPDDTQPPPENETQSQNPIIPLIQASVKIMKQAQLYGQAYDQLQQKYMQVANIYQNQLMELLPSIAMLTAKTPLSSMTDDDLVHHIEQLYTTVPFQVALANTDKLVKGYYISKINGINTKELDTADLMQVAENPAFAQSTDENLAQFLGRLGAIIQMKMQTALKQAGMVKDMYQEKIKEMQLQGQIMHYIATGLVNMAKVNETERHHKALEKYLEGRLGIEETNAKLRQKDLNLKKDHLDALKDYWNKKIEIQKKRLESKEKKSSNSSSGTVPHVK